MIDPDFLLNDFYTNSVISSPKLIFAYIIYFFNILGIEWYTSLYFLKLFCVFFIPSLLFLTMYEICLRWFPENLSQEKNENIKIFLFLCALGIPAYFQGTKSWLGPFGWGAIQSYNFLSPMMLSFLLGFFYNYLLFKKNNLKILKMLMIIISFLLHPIVGFCNFIVATIFLLPISFNKQNFVNLCIDFIFGIILPTLFFIYFFQNSSSISAENFVKYYVKIRHPHHYLMTKIVSMTTVTWILFFAAPLLYSIHIKDKKSIIISSLSFISFVLAPLIQFLGTEVWQIKIIAEIGPSRFTAYASIVWSLNVAIIYSRNCEVECKKVKKFLSYFVFVIKTILFFIQKTFTKKETNVLFSIFIFFTVFIITYQHPLDYYKEGKAKEIIKWVSEKTSKESTFFVINLDSFLVRVYGQRAVFADSAFPFNEGYIEEFTERFLIYINAHKFNKNDYFCLKKYYLVDYLIIPSYIKMEDNIPEFSSNNWSIYKIDNFKSDVVCNKSKFLL